MWRVSLFESPAGAAALFSLCVEDAAKTTLHDATCEVIGRVEKDGQSDLQEKMGDVFDEVLGETLNGECETSLRCMKNSP